MTTISVPLKPQQEKFIDSLVKSGKVANKAHAVRYALDALREVQLIQGNIDPLSVFRLESARDIAKEVGAISKEDYDYYERL